MKINENFYGQAIREIEKGIRRDNLWAKAFATSMGDMQKAKAIYIELLAQYFAELAHLGAESIREKEDIKKAVNKAATMRTIERSFINFLRFSIWLVILIISSAAFLVLAESMHKNYALEQANNYQPAGISEREFYRAVVAQNNEKALDDFSAEVRDAMTLDRAQILSKYGVPEGQDLNRKVLNALALYRLQIKDAPSYLEAIKAEPFNWAASIISLFIFICVFTRAIFKNLFRKNLKCAVS